MPSTEYTYPPLPAVDYLPPQEHGRHEAPALREDYRDWLGRVDMSPNNGVSTAQPGVVPPSFSPSETVAMPAIGYQAPGNLQVTPGYPVQTARIIPEAPSFYPRAQAQSDPYGSQSTESRAPMESRAPYPRRLITADEMSMPPEAKPRPAIWIHTNDPLEDMQTGIPDIESPVKKDPSIAPIPGARSANFLGALEARHDAYTRAQDILNSRHYETQAERLDAEIRLAEWLLGQ